MQTITLYRRDFKEAEPGEDVDFFADLLFELGYGTLGDYESVAHINEVAIDVSGTFIESS